MPSVLRLSLRSYVCLALLGFASGLPLYLAGSTLRGWMTTEGLDLRVIGAFVLVRLPYSLKVFWAPFLDRYSLPLLGRRRGWMFLAQGGMALALLLMAFWKPTLGLAPMVMMAILLTFTSASFDIAVDAWRAEAFPQAQLGLVTSYHIAAYRLAMVVSSALAMALAGKVGWRTVYVGMAALTVLGMVGTWMAPSTDDVASPPRTLAKAVVEPLKDLLKRPGIAELAAFAVLYKLGDWLAEAMTMPFLIRGMGFSLLQIGMVQKTTAMVAIIVGGILGGIILTKVSLRKALLGFGLLQAASILGFWSLTLTGPSLTMLVVANGLENLAFGMGGSAFAALFMGSCNRAYTGTQYALFTSLMSLPSTVFASGTGFLAERVGWSTYFLLCAVAALPGLLLLLRYRKWGLPE